MRRVAATVTVVTGSHAGVRGGMTATAVTPVCLTPPSLLVCVNSSASIHPLIKGSGAFCVNVLRDGQDAIATLFGGKVAQAERFASEHWAEDAHGLPFLDDAQAAIFCDLADQVSYGTHSVFIGRVNRVWMADAVSPLVYADGKFSRLLEV
jgi:flavin reductase (DIM6/NTAB) family NADH-FMN oxidoreductase RutF